MNIKSKDIKVMIISSLVLLASACNTVKGVGQDLESAGDAAEDVANDVAN